MSIGIVDVGIGNIGSLRGALYSQGWDTVTVAGADDMVGISHLILPGVGAFAAAMHRLHTAGLVEPIRQHSANGRPLLGICLGMQLLAEVGAEGGRTMGLGLIPGEVVLLEVDARLRLPHVGWNQVRLLQEHPLCQSVRADVDFYFVHSYFFKVRHESDVVGSTEYGMHFPSFVAHGNVVGVQFHPEKSQRNGLRILDNFSLWDGTC